MPQPGPRATQLLRQTMLFRTLNDQQLAQVAAHLKEVVLPRGTIIFQQGDDGDCLYVIGDGRVRIYLPGPEGREITFRMFEPGQIFGEFAVLDNKVRSASAIALTPVRAFVLYRDAFWDLLRHNFDLVERLIAALTERLRYTTRVLERQSFLSARGRLAEMLLLLASLEPNVGEPVRLAISQQELADYINTTREWVNQTLQSFADEGLIRIERRAVILLKPGQLADLAV
jgi:CRP/FNR family transcriptional regulator, cyclic AMP receptor protein